jgi:PAS domain S-box-containing protein
MAERKPVRFEAVSPIIGRRVGVSIYPEEQGGLSCYFRDIEEEKRDEGRLRQLTEGLNLSQVMVRALDGTVEFWSAGCTRLYGFKAEEAPGHVSHDLLRTGFPEPLEHIHERLLSAGRWHGELRHTRADGSPVFVESDWVLHRDSGGEIRAVIEANTDITEQKAAQHQLERANQELSQFSHIVSHDLQAPLRMVRTYAELLARRYSSKLGDPADEMLRFILQGAESRDRLIRTLLEYAVFRRCLSADHRLLDQVALYEKETFEVKNVTPDEMAKLMSAADERIAVCFALAGFAGLRTAEVLRLDWGDIDSGMRYVRLLRIPIRAKRRMAFVTSRG